MTRPTFCPRPSGSLVGRPIAHVYRPCNSKFIRKSGNSRRNFYRSAAIWIECSEHRSTSWGLRLSWSLMSFKRRVLPFSKHAFNRHVFKAIFSGSRGLPYLFPLTNLPICFMAVITPLMKAAMRAWDGLAPRVDWTPVFSVKRLSGTPKVPCSLPLLAFLECLCIKDVKSLHHTL